ncbi:DHA2 family efflux MFS transporter permease subunit [Seleniivibrio sp.]|uniref:DHA2 family efflux MFS transporter permease subunit n=1 Tax=Seleniivibrio sp. TaxID=2898801 RepID=UPI0025F181A0|nr:DHA2 family efflux MFS transporter permease subunit [Seleniivibrio sp.]MCD8554500.1 DHA2 family efflux MFS transporter permease subunit [Seleniivibrio sp.]
MKQNLQNKDISEGNFAMMSVLLISAFFAVLNETYLNVALTKFMEIFNVTMSQVQWLTTGFMLVMAIVIPTTAFIMERFSIRRIYITTLLLIISGTLIGGFSVSFGMLFAGRLIQAAGTCVLMTLMTNTILIITPHSRRGAAMGLVGLVVLFAPAVAPAFAGVVLKMFDWRWLFYILAFPLTVTLLLGLKYIKNITETHPVKIDLLSVILSSVGLGGILYVISELENSGSDIKLAVVFLIGISSIIFFVLRQFRLERPLLDLRVFKKPMYCIGVSILTMCMMIIFAFTLLSPIFMQGAMNLSFYAIGLAMLPGGIMNGFASPVAGKIFDRTGPKIPVVTGLIIMAAVTLFLTSFDKNTSVETFITAHCVLMLAVALVATSIQTLTLNQLDKNEYAHGTAILMTFQQLGGGLGTAVFVGIMSFGKNMALDKNADSVSAITSGFHLAFISAFILIIFALVLSLFIRRR